MAKSRGIYSGCRPLGSRLTTEVARELCQRAGCKAYLVGSISSIGNKYVLELKAVNCQNGVTIAEEQSVTASKDNVLDALGEAASRLSLSMTVSV